MFFDDSLKGLKKELKNAGADLSFVKTWQKSFDKVKKQAVAIEAQYTKAKLDLEAVMKCLNQLETVLISANTKGISADLKNEISTLAKDMKKYQANFNQEFLIGKEDKEFHLIYETILSLCTKNVSEKKNILILQSEVENLSAITREALEKTWPEFRAMAYYYLGHSDREICDLPHQEKVDMVTKYYKDEFYNPMNQILEASLGEGRAKEIMEVELWI